MSNKIATGEGAYRDRKALNPLLKWLWDLLSFYSTDVISVPNDFHGQVAEVKDVMKSDTSGLVASVLDFAINTALVDYTIESDNSELNDLIEEWMGGVNKVLVGRVPIGIKGLAKEYFRERWKNSSMIVLRTTWETTDVGGTSFILPTKMWFVDGGNIVVNDGEENEVRTIGAEKYYIKITDKKKKAIPASKEELIFVQKPFDSWTSLYSTPFLIQRGLWRNLKLYDLINKKGEKFISKALEYMLLFKHGTEQLALKGNPDFTYSEDDLKKAKDDLKDVLNRNKGEGGTPVYSTNFDTEMQHLVPDYSVVLKEAIYTPLERRLLAGLGLIEIVEGVSSTRKEAILNPKPFIREVETGINDFASLIQDIITVIKEKNKDKHPKYVANKIELHYSPVTDFLSDSVRDHLRSMYDRGILSKETYAEVIGNIDVDIEVSRRVEETDGGLDDILYPPIITNREEVPDVKDGQPPAKKPNEKIPEEKLGPEAKNFKGVYEDAPYRNNEDLPPAVKKYPVHVQDIFRNAFNSALKTYKKESTAFRVAWSALKKYMKSHKGEIKNE